MNCVVRSLATHANLQFFLAAKGRSVPGVPERRPGPPRGQSEPQSPTRGLAERGFRPGGGREGRGGVPENRRPPRGVGATDRPARLSRRAGRARISVGGSRPAWAWGRGRSRTGSVASSDRRRAEAGCLGRYPPRGVCSGRDCRSSHRNWPRCRTRR